MISFGREICSQYGTASAKEWLETNGIGGYAYGTVCLSSTRRTQGPLIIAPEVFGPQYVLLNRFEEKIVNPGISKSISCQRYTADTIAPLGYELLERFSVDIFPEFTYLIDDSRIKKTIFMLSGENTVVCIYELLSGSPVQIELQPLISMRLNTDVLKADQRFDDAVTYTEDTVTITAQSIPALTLKTSAGFFQTAPCWYYQLRYENDGPDTFEDLFCPGIFRFSLWPGKKTAVVASIEKLHDIQPEKLLNKELFIRSKIIDNFPIKGSFAKRLATAADQFIISGPHTAGIVSGYPSNEKSMKETLIALPGLCLVNGRFPEAKEILIKCLDTIINQTQGDISNGAHGKKSPVHDQYVLETILWFFWALQKYVEHSGDIECIRAVHDQLMSLYVGIRRGISSTAQMADDGLIQYDDTIKNRMCKHAHVQALWYNALQFLEEIEIKIGGKRKRYKDLALRVRESFNTHFWNEASAYLYRSISNHGADSSIVPEALLAISLPYPVLEQKRFEAVFTTAWKKLYTSYGLRSLDPAHPQYIGSITESSVLNGQPDGPGYADPFWIGPFITAYRKIFGHQIHSTVQAWHFLTPFEDHLSEAMIGSVSEYFAGNAPHKSFGRPASSVGVAELMRVLVEDIGNQPEHKQVTISEIMPASHQPKKLGGQA